MSRQVIASNSAVTGTAANVGPNAPGVQTRQGTRAAQVGPVGQGNQAPSNSVASSSEPEIRRSGRDRKPRIPQDASPISRNPRTNNNGNGRKRGGANGRNQGNGAKKPRDETPIVEYPDEDDYNFDFHSTPNPVVLRNRVNSVGSLGTPEVGNDMAQNDMQMMREPEVPREPTPEVEDPIGPQDDQPERPDFAERALQLDEVAPEERWDPEDQYDPQDHFDMAPQELHAPQNHFGVAPEAPQHFFGFAPNEQFALPNAFGIAPNEQFEPPNAFGFAPNEQFEPQNFFGFAGVPIHTWSTGQVVQWVGQTLGPDEHLLQTQERLRSQAIRGEVLLALLEDHRRDEFIRYVGLPWGHIDIITRQLRILHNFIM